jgi:hypothetical protein
VSGLTSLSLIGSLICLRLNANRKGSGIPFLPPLLGWDVYNGMYSATLSGWSSSQERSLDLDFSKA